MRSIGGLAVLAVLALSACASPAASVEPVTPDPAVASSYDESYSADEFFIAGVKLGWIGEKPSNTELVKMGQQACQGALPASGENAKRITEYAKAVYCP
ncbi:hypothetical protein FQP90_13580 [Paenarthrobacter nitroguajacolicus]|uniref:DUF732 domain-containing protein n=1 Tax=Paenarthrobacter nitroguajacolicus TaxID=211146 RepID=A0A558GXJ5_PAENT|nr:hypothetical protein [Paenarthrobacter nitroguajacolicus]TVU61566.1 hypothetical protein FQP90_13580 [Paenarthrobacter nitroguajacolicus]